MPWERRGREGCDWMQVFFDGPLVRAKGNGHTGPCVLGPRWGWALRYSGGWEEGRRRLLRGVCGRHRRAALSPVGGLPALAGGGRQCVGTPSGGHVAKPRE